MPAATTRPAVQVIPLARPWWRRWWEAWRARPSSTEDAVWRELRYLDVHVRRDIGAPEGTTSAATSFTDRWLLDSRNR